MQLPPDFRAELEERDRIDFLEVNFSLEHTLFLGLLISSSLGSQVLDGPQFAGRGARLR